MTDDEIRALSEERRRREEAESYQHLHRLDADRAREEEAERDRMRAAGKRDSLALRAGEKDMHRAARQARRAARKGASS